MLRRAARLARLSAALAVALPAHGALRTARMRSGWVRRFLGMAAGAAGVDVRIVGEPLARDVLFVANHASWLDILVIGGATGAAFVSKDSVARWPVVGSLARIGGTIFISRARRGAARGQIEAIAAALATHRPVAMFPEGTTGDGQHLLPFRASLFAAAGAGIRVQPIAIDYGAAMAEIAWPKHEPAASNAKRVFDRPGRIGATLHVLHPLDPAAFPDRKALAAAAEAAVASALGRR